MPIRSRLNGNNERVSVAALKASGAEKTRHVLRPDLSDIFLISGKGAKGKSKNDVAHAFGLLRDTGSQVLVRDEIQEPLSQIVAAKRFPLLQTAGWR